jgi:hypothetical protein
MSPVITLTAKKGILAIPTAASIFYIYRNNYYFVSCSAERESLPDHHTLDFLHPATQVVNC